MLENKGWKRLSDKLKQSAEETGRICVYPGIKEDILKDRLIRANEHIKIILEVESIASRIPDLEDKFNAVRKISENN